MSQIFDANIMNAFIEGTINVLKTMCGMEIHPGKPSLKKNKTTTGDISGTISLSSADQRGIVILSFSKKAVLLIVTNMISEEKTWIDLEVKDAVGELTNVIAGDTRNKCQEFGNRFEAGIPTVIVGPDHEIYTPVSESAPVISIPFTTCEGDPFSIDFAFESIKK